MEHLRRKLETDLAYHKMSPEQIRLTENRIMTFGLGPENFVESAGYASYTFDEEREAPAIRKALSELDDATLGSLHVELRKYESYLLSQAGKLAAVTGGKPSLERDGVGHFGVTKRASFLLQAVSEEARRRGIGFWKTLALTPETLGIGHSIRREVKKVRDKKSTENERDENFGEHYLEEMIDAFNPPPPLDAKERAEVDTLLKILEEKERKEKGK